MEGGQEDERGNIKNPFTNAVDDDVMFLYLFLLKDGFICFPFDQTESETVGERIDFFHFVCFSFPFICLRFKNAG